MQSATQIKIIHAKKEKKKKEKCEMGKDIDNKFEHPGKSYENFKVI